MVPDRTHLNFLCRSVPTGHTSIMRAGYTMSSLLYIRNCGKVLLGFGTFFGSRTRHAEFMQ